MENKAAVDQVLAAETARRRALESADKKALGALLADDFTYVHGSGRVEDKQSYVGGQGAGRIRFSDYTSKDVVIKVQEGSALVFGELLAMRHLDGQSAPSRFRFVGSWTKVGDKWLLAFYQHTKFPDAPHA